jgi:murein endopeptidase
MYKFLIIPIFLATLLAQTPALARTGAGMTGAKTQASARGANSGSSDKRVYPRLRVWQPKDLVRLKSGPGWRVRRPHHSWGTPLTVSRLRSVLRARHQQFPAATPVPVYDMSRQTGGQLDGHYSHRRGRDSDLGIPSMLSAKNHWRQRDRDLEHTLFLVLGLLRTCDVEFILLDWEAQRLLMHHALSRGVTADEAALIFQAPGRGPFGLVRHRAKHRQHIHVRFRKEAGSDEPPRQPRIVTDKESLEELCHADAGRPLVEKIFSRLYE